MIRAIIIDDEAHCVKSLENDLKMFCGNVEVMDTCFSAKEGMLSIKRNKPDLIFLDVEMPWMNGFEMLEVLGDDIGFHIIFTTAYDQFAARAFRVSAVDYLLKPIDSNDLINAVNKTAEILKSKTNGGVIQNLLQNNKTPVERQKMAIPSREGYDFVPVNEIIYCRASGAYTDVILNSGKKLLLSQSLGETEQLLPEELFERVHHSLVVNVQHINQYKRTSGTSIIMINGDELNVSKSKKEHLLTRLGIK
ncbi:MAG TPA: LytTR family DNA-binding domain-containing protein [Saprospiraceae bacterium]|nr:LytTR family DNA-binding domain-containing protein [Saprospiraceae bacterium]